MKHLSLFGLLRLLFLGWKERHKLCYHLCVFLYFWFLSVCCFDWFALSRLILLLEVLYLVIIIATFLQIDLHFTGYCSYGCCFAYPWPTSDDKSKQTPLVILDTLLDFVGVLLWTIIYEAIFLTYFVFILEKCIKPLLYFLGCFNVKQLRNLTRRILCTPQGKTTRLYVLLYYLLYQFFLYDCFFSYCIDKLCYFRAFLKNLIIRGLFEPIL